MPSWTFYGRAKSRGFPRNVPSYSGPGDVISGAIGWWGLRGYNKAYATGTNPALDLDSGAGSTVTINILADGTLDVATAAPLVATYKVSKLYDQSGNGRHLTQATHAFRPTLSLSGIYALFCSTTGEFLLGPATITQTQPYSLSEVVMMTGAEDAVTFEANSGEFQFLWTAGVVQLQCNSPPLNDGSLAQNAAGAMQGLANGASSIIRCNGSSASGDAGTTNLSNSAAQWGTGLGDVRFTETGLWGGDKSDSFGALEANQRTFWGF